MKLERFPCIPILVTLVVSSLAGCGGSGEAPDPGIESLPDDLGTPGNLDARARGFRLFYRERLDRILTAYNRFAMAGDVVPATSFGRLAVARQGSSIEVVPGPNDNNPIGHAAFVAYQAYKAMGGRVLELTLVRLFHGLAFLEAVTGHPGLTCREALPGWTRIVDGFQGTVTRLKDGIAVQSPVLYAPSLEQEIVSTFYDGVIFTYREDPFEYYYHLKPVQELEQFAITWVFSEYPYFLRISDCCSSWMISKKGPWKGAYWGNHNSRDNFPDLAIGYLAAMECARDPSAPAELREAARQAAQAGRRVGESSLAHEQRLMTVGEFGTYDELTPSGKIRPDGFTEWQDLGSISSCQMDYLALALSYEGLSLPVPGLLLPGALEKAWLEQVVRDLGLSIPVPDMFCTDLDQAYLGTSWKGLLESEICGMPWYEFAKILSGIDPGLIPSLLGPMMDDFQELELAVLAIGYYARIFEKPDVFESARVTLRHLVELHRILADLVYGENAGEMRYTAAVRARMFGLETPLDDFLDFRPADLHNRWIESQLTRPDTAPWPLVTDAEITAKVEHELPGREKWIQDRYRARFRDTPPVRRTGQGYEAVGPDGDWIPVETPRHEWFDGYSFLSEMPLCVYDPSTLDCSWASMGCRIADLDGNGRVDEADKGRFEQAWSRFGPIPRARPAMCSAGNRWCDGADLTRGGRVNEEDRAFLEAAQGCTM